MSRDATVQLRIRVDHLAAARAETFEEVADRAERFGYALVPQGERGVYRLVGWGRKDNGYHDLSPVSLEEVLGDDEAAKASA